jgi:beta-N-acetylhexosaminidase
MDYRSLSVEQLAGQRLMAGFDGTQLDAGLEFLISGLKVGGLILFRRNVAGPEQLTELCRSAQQCAAAAGQPPLFIAIDQEGGQVARLGPPFTQFPGNPAMRGASDAEHFAAVTAAELSAVGINMNMAPVLDVAPPDMDSVMAKRVFGADPHRVAALGTAVVEGLQSRRVMAVAKHFPGIGRTRLDSHLDLPVLDQPLESLEACDLIPFCAVLDKPVAAVMLSHILYRQIDPKWPASLSRRIAKGLLRDRLGYGGVVVTDDLEMGAVVRHYGLAEVIGRVLKAEIDVALICHSAEKLAFAAARIARKIGGSDRVRGKALASVGRIMALKEAFLG